ncbi:CAP domain-containing protein [Paracoccaceae bacterium GXU_MW_L88]
MFKKIILAGVAAAALAACSTGPTAAPVQPGQGLGFNGSQIPAGSEADIQYRHLDAVNALRAQSGLSPLQLNASLNAAALTHARDMSVQKRAWHFGSDGASPQQRANRAGYTARVVQENIAEAYEGEFQVMKTWVSEENTRQAMVDPSATDLGLAYVQDPDGKLWWVQLLGDSRQRLIASTVQGPDGTFSTESMDPQPIETVVN